MNILPKKPFFSKEQETLIVSAIKAAELNTSGEIKVHVEKKVTKDTFARGLEKFAELQMHQTKFRNGVLFYLATDDHKFAIVADEGINQVVPKDFWHEITKEMEIHFKKSQFTEGLSKGIQMAGEQLKAHFPYHKEDSNEISDEISTE
jgi:uncharacterized membrane protein